MAGMGLYANIPKKKDLNKEIQTCREGYEWDNEIQACVPIPGYKPEKTNVNPAPGSVETFKNPQTGRGSGVVLPDGRTFLGLNPNDINQIAQAEAQKTAQNPINAQPVGTAQNQVEQQQRIQQLTQMAQEGLLTPQELESITGAKLDIGQALGAGAASAVPGILGGAVTGATVGALGGPLGAVGGAVIGGLGTFLAGVRSNIKSQQVGEFSADKAALTNGEKYLRSLITDTNKNPQNAPQNIALFYQTLNLIDAAHQKTFKDSQEDLNRFLGNDGTPELARFEVFDATMRNYYISQFNTALAQPNPNNILITTEDLEIEE